jgi:subtilisin family serine protease
MKTLFLFCFLFFAIGGSNTWDGCFDDEPEPPPLPRLVPNDYSYNAEQFDAVKMPEAWHLMQGKWVANATFPWVVVIDDGYFPSGDLGIRIDAFPGFPDGTAWGDIPPEGNAPGYGFHGTAVLSLLASDANNGKGIAGLAGRWEELENGQMAGPLFYPVRIGDDPILPFHVTHLKAAFHEVVLAHPQIRVVNISKSIITLSELPGSELEQLFNRAKSEWILIVTGAGNKRENRPEDIWLNQFDHVLIVGGLNKAGTDLWIHDDDDIHGTATGEAIDIYAPAEELSVLIKHLDIRRDSGTSYATPFVSAIASMIYALNTDILQHPEVVKDLIIKTADMIEVGNPSYSIPRLNAYRAIDCACKVETSSIVEQQENNMIKIIGEQWFCTTWDEQTFTGQYLY